jgi:hypothetical protein
VVIHYLSGELKMKLTEEKSKIWAVVNDGKVIGEFANKQEGKVLRDENPGSRIARTKHHRRGATV